MVRSAFCYNLNMPDKKFFDVATIGSATQDAFLEADFKTVSWKKTLSGRAYLLPAGEKLEVKKFYLTIGGNSANASVTFTRQGFHTACATKVGADAASEEIKRRLEDEGVKTFFARNSRLATAHSTLILENGERTILGYHGASDSFALHDLRLAKLRAKWWYVSLAGESDVVFRGVVNFARRNDIAVAFNPSGHHLRHRRGEILALLPGLSFLVLNEEEAALLTGVSFKNEKAVFGKLDRLMPGVLAVTNGRGGVTVSDGRFVYKAGVFKEKKLVDRTGAGDAFGSGFVAGLLHRDTRHETRDTRRKFAPDDIKYAIRLATANATSVVEKIGATEGILTKKDFETPRFKNLSILVRRLS